MKKSGLTFFFSLKNLARLLRHSSVRRSVLCGVCIFHIYIYIYIYIYIIHIYIYTIYGTGIGRQRLIKKRENGKRKIE